VTEEQPTPAPNLVAAAANRADRVKPRRISKRIRTACDALVSGEVTTIKDAARLANLSREHLSRELSKPHIGEYLRQKALRALAISAGRAAAVKIELLDSASEHVRNDASTFVLGLASIKPATAPQLSVNIELRAGYVIVLSDHASTYRDATASIVNRHETNRGTPLGPTESGNRAIGTRQEKSQAPAPQAFGSHR
jgi:hypothetical protein